MLQRFIIIVATCFCFSACVNVELPLLVTSKYEYTTSTGIKKCSLGLKRANMHASDLYTDYNEKYCLYEASQEIK